MSQKLFIGNCSFGLEEATLVSFIQDQGVEVDSVQIIRDRDTGRSRGFAFAELGEGANISSAIDALNGQELDGRALTVNEARERTSSGGGRQGFGGNNRGGGNGGNRRW